MFKHFIGKIYVLEQPPEEIHTQLDIPFPEEILGDLDETTYEGLLTQEQIAKLKLHNEEMADLIGAKIYSELKGESAFQSSNSELKLN